MPMNIITDEKCAEYSTAGHPERPQRITSTLELLRRQKTISLEWTGPIAFDETSLLRAHTQEHLRVLEQSVAFDGDTPAYPKIGEFARRSVGAALQALKLARVDKPSFSLMRPPGHHATRDRAMGFCYLNSIAVAVLEALVTGSTKAAVFDFDVHHGNGTEAILLNHLNAYFFSIHQHPCYPGTGTKNVGSNCFNFPVAPRTPRAEYRRVFSRALDDLKRLKPDLIAVSAGFDAYARDPLAQETLEREDFYWLGRSIRDLGIPNFSVLEGGYSSDLPELILAYLQGLQGK